MAEELIVLTSADEVRDRYTAVYPEVEALFHHAFKREISHRVWDQLYFHNPYGAPIIVLDCVDGRLIGHFAMIPQQFVGPDGAVYPYVLSVSAMVHSEFRGGRRFHKMVEAAQAAASTQKYLFALAYPNANSLVPFVDHLRWTFLGETPLCDIATIIPALPAPTIAPLESWRISNDICVPDTLQYRQWRSMITPYHAVRLGDAISMIYKLDSDGILTVLDVEADSPADGAALLDHFVMHTGATGLRMPGTYAERAGIPASRFAHHRGYYVRVIALPLYGEIPAFRHSLLPSDVF